MTWQEELESLVRQGLPGLRSENELLTSICQLLEEILAELKHSNSIAREGAVSSVQIEDTAKGPRCTTKHYAGSAPELDQALDDHGYVVREAERRAIQGWQETVDDVERRRA